MRKFKKIDLFINIILIVGSLIVSCFYLKDLDFLACYFIVGGWQCISMLVHAAKHWFTHRDNIRIYYHWLTVISLATMPIGSFYILLFIAPLMAVCYTIICFDEIYFKMRRPLSLLK